MCLAMCVFWHNKGPCGGRGRPGMRCSRCGQYIYQQGVIIRCDTVEEDNPDRLCEGKGFPGTQCPRCLWVLGRIQIE
jgi:hypothetical protein